MMMMTEHKINSKILSLNSSSKTKRIRYNIHFLSLTPLALHGDRTYKHHCIKLYQKLLDINQLIKTNTTQSYLSKWDTVKHGVPHGSVLGPLLFVIYINDLPLHINAISDPILFADDTSVLISKDSCEEFQQTANLVLSNMSKWFEANQLVLNMEKSNMLKFKTSKS
jgi:hypothetical protein